MEGGWERKHEEMGKRDELWGCAEVHPDLTCPISPSLEEEEGEAGNPCSKAGLAADHIPTQKYCCTHHESGPGYSCATQPPPQGGLVPPQGARSPPAKSP